MFSDESVFQQVCNAGSNYVRRPVGERYNLRYTIKTVKHPLSVMIWRSISAAGRGGLAFIRKGDKMNAAKYIEILNERLQIHMAINGTTAFQQDSAPCHVAKVVKQWFASNSIQLLENWPSNSPDLNEIENCWAYMKNKVAEHRPTSEKHLVDILKQVWPQEISAEYCKKLVKSMPQRIQGELDNNGNPTKY